MKIDDHFALYHANNHYIIKVTAISDKQKTFKVFLGNRLKCIVKVPARYAIDQCSDCIVRKIDEKKDYVHRYAHLQNKK